MGVDWQVLATKMNVQLLLQTSIINQTIIFGAIGGLFLFSGQKVNLVIFSYLLGKIWVAVKVTSSGKVKKYKNK